MDIWYTELFWSLIGAIVGGITVYIAIKHGDSNGS